VCAHIVRRLSEQAQTGVERLQRVRMHRHPGNGRAAGRYFGRDHTELDRSARFDPFHPEGARSVVRDPELVSHHGALHDATEVVAQHRDVVVAGGSAAKGLP